jgi:serine/threonine-protein kinase RsbW
MGPEEARSACAFGRTVPAVAENVASLRHAVVDLADRHGAGDDVKTDLALAVGEACANVVVHAYPPGDVGPLVVHAEIKGNEIIVEVCDQGQGMTPRPDSPGLGLGLPLIANLAERLEITDGPGDAGTQLMMAFTLRRS